MIFEVRNGTFGYQAAVPVLKDISFQVQSRQVLAILEPNGVGKTTLLRNMMGMLIWTGGGSYLDGVNIRDMAPGQLWKEMAYVPQAKSFPFSFTVEEMIQLGRSTHIGFFGTPSKEDRERCERAMEDLGITHMRHKLCNRISGGELQMVLIARALCAEAKLLVLDEPESNLDFRNQLIILETIQRLSKEEGICCIFNTHYPGHALRISDRLLVLSREGTADYYKDKETLVTIRKAVDASPELRSKKELIETFLDGINDVDDVMLEWRSFVAERKEQELETIIKEERLKPEETRKFIEASIQADEIRTVGTDIDKLMPPASHFGGGNRAAKKQNIIERLKAFFGQLLY